MDPRSFPASNWYRRLALALAMGCFVSPTLAADDRARPERPNIVLINADDK